jgi:hypothetical protein
MIQIAKKRPFVSFQEPFEEATRLACWPEILGNWDKHVTHQTSPHVPSKLDHFRGMVICQSIAIDTYLTFIYFHFTLQSKSSLAMLDADVLMGICRLPARISRWLRLGIKVHAHAAQALRAGISTPLGDTNFAMFWGPDCQKSCLESPSWTSKLLYYL